MGTPLDLNTNRSEHETKDEDIALSLIPSPKRFNEYFVEGGASGFFSTIKLYIYFCIAQQ